MDIITLTHYTTVPLAFLLQLATAVLIVRKKQVRTFPVFFAYTIFHVVETATSFVAFRISYLAYLYTYWTGEMLDTVFTLAVIQEIFLVTFQPYEALRRWGSRIYVLGAILCSRLRSSWALSIRQDTPRDCPYSSPSIAQQYSYR